jgi:hypothetical protein
MAPRLDTPLSRALLESGSLDPAALEDAVQEQVVHGGALDTILLEKGAVPERKLAELLAKAWSTEPVDLDKIEHPAADATRVLPERMALTMRLCPFALEGNQLHVLAPAPLDRALVDELSAMLSRPIVAHVVPEVRLWQGLQNAYGTAPDERFASLLTDLQVPASTGRASSDSSTGISSEGDAEASDPGAARWDLVEALAHLAAQESRDGVARVAVSYARKYLPFAAMLGIRRVDGRHQCVGWLRSGPAEGVQFHNKPFVVTEDCALDAALKSPSPSLGKPQITPGNAALFGWLGRRRPRTFLAVPIVVAGKTVGALVADGGIRARDFASFADLVSFAARLGPAFEALLRQRHKQHPSLFPIPAPEPAPAPAPSADAPAQAEAAAPPPVDENKPEAPRHADIHAEVTAPLPPFQPKRDDVPAPPPLVPPPPTQPRPITMTAMPRVELRPPPRDAKDTSPRDGTSPFARKYLATRPYGAPEPPPPPPRAPVVVEDLSGLAKIEAPAAFSEVTDSHATAAWKEALQDAVARGHQGGTVAPEEKARIFLDDDGWEDVRYEGGADGEARSSAAPAIAMPVFVQLANAVSEAVSGGAAVDEGATARATVSDAEPVTELERPSPVEELVDQLAALDDVVVARAKRQLLERSDVAVPALSARFPGRLRVDPFDPGENVRAAAELGPLVDVVYSLGAVGLDAAIPHLDSRYPAHRYAAVLLFVLTPDPRAIDLLRARLHDQEPRIRQLAADALAPFVAHGRFEAVLVHLRERLQSPLLDARRRAVQLLGAFRDVGAVPTLIAVLESSRGAGELAEDAHQALRVITLQDFGVRARGWDKWWQKAKKRSRVDWLIKGLQSEDRELRTIAQVELTSITGDDFGYRADAPRRLRQRAVTIFEGWWLEEQKRQSSQPRAG